MFREAGLDRAVDDPAALSVKGRLLKDRAIAASGKARHDCYRGAAQAYSRAAHLSGTCYPLINAATLSLLAGDKARSRRLARQVLAHREDETETAYWKAATRAEAYLLLGEIANAKLTLTEALCRAPYAFEDHASTLRQFGLILEALGQDAAWLDTLRPPRCVHFAGSMGLSATAPSLTAKIRDFVARERVGFGYGALAAGADLLAAEALLAEGAEIHVYLPAAIDTFRKTSVSPYGASWTKRFDAVLAKANRVQVVADEGQSALGVRLAAEIAMGNAAMHARLLTTEAIQLLLFGPRDKARRKTASGSIGEIWKRSGRRQQVMTAGGRNVAGHYSKELAQTQSGCLAAVLCIQADAAERQPHVLRHIAKILSGGKALLRPRWNGDSVLAAFSTAGAAADRALAIASAMRGAVRIGGHYSVVRTLPDPFGTGQLLAGASARVAQEIAGSAPDSAIHVSENFAAALFAASAKPPRIENLGELPAETGRAIGLFALLP